MSESLLDLLKAVKDGVLCYAVKVEYGQQEPGLDDTGDSDEKRQLRVIGYPAGFLGGCVMVWQGTLPELLGMDVFAAPEIVPNPPRDAVFRGPYDLKPGAFCWGDRAETSRLAEKLAERRAKWDAR